MKRLLLLSLAAAPLVVHAQFTFTTNSGTLTITRYTSSIGTVVIPATTNGLPIVGIGSQAFQNFLGLTNLTIPNSITNIGGGAFYFCGHLKAIMVDPANPSYSSTNGVLFNKNQTTLVQYPCGLTGNYKIPESVTTIGYAAFETCGNLTNIAIPNSVTIITDYAFYLCPNLTNVTIGSGVTNLWYQAFGSCPKLTGIYFQGNAPISIQGLPVFAGDNATIYYLPGTSGWSSPFDGLPTVMLNPPDPAGSLQVTLSPAAAITNGAKWQVDGGLAQPSGAIVSGLSVGDHTVSFISGNGWAIPTNQMITVSADATATTSGVYAQLTWKTNNGAITITGYTGPGTAVIIPSTINGLPVVAIQSGAFQNRSSLTSITIPDTVVSIGNQAFNGCSSLTSIYFPANAPTLGSSVFANDPDAIVYYLPGTSGWSSPFGGVPAVMLNPPNPNGSLQVTLSSAAAITNGAQWRVDGGLAQPSGAIVSGLSVGTHTVSFNPLNGWATPINQTIVVSADSTATASGTYGQLSYTTNSGAIMITACAGNPKAVILPGTINGLPVTAIFGYVFQSSTLTNITIPASVVAIGTQGFYACPFLTSVYFQGNAPTLGANVFTLDPKATIYYPPGTSGWSSPFGGSPAVMLNPQNPNGSLQVTLSPAAPITAGAKWQVDGGLTQSSGAIVSGLSVGNHTISFSFVNGWAAPANEIVTVSADSTVVTNGVYAQLTWTTNNGAITITGYTGSATGLSLPSTINGLPVVSIGYEAFQYQKGLTTVTIPNSITNLGYQAFLNCTSLASVMIGSGVTDIEPGTFFNCTNLAAIMVDTNNPVYSSVGGVLFSKDQTTLVEYPLGAARTYTIPDSVLFIGNNAFARCSSLTNLTFGTNVIALGDLAFDSCTGLTSITMPYSLRAVGNDTFRSCTGLTTLVFGTNLTTILDDAFQGCSSLTSVYFEGNAPNLFSGIFGGDNATVYYLPGTTGWDTTFSGVPAVLWNPQATAFIADGNQFGFNITGPGNVTIVVEAAMDLTNPVWLPVSTNTLNNSGTSFFSDPQWKNYPNRLYRFRSP